MRRRPPRSTLFPCTTLFRSAREKGRQAVCLSNLRQIGAAMMLYVQDYDETFPGGPVWTLERNLYVPGPEGNWRSEAHTSELQSRQYLVCRLLLVKTKPQLPA